MRPIGDNVPLIATTDSPLRMVKTKKPHPCMYCRKMIAKGKRVLNKNFGWFCQINCMNNFEVSQELDNEVQL